MKRLTVEWVSPGDQAPKKLGWQKSRLKTMLIIFFDYPGIIRKEFVSSGQTVTAHFY